MFTAVLFIHILDDFFAAVIGDVEIDVGRFAALLGEEAFEQQFEFDRVDGGDFEAVADSGVGGGAATLAEDPVLFAEAGDVPDDDEIAGQLEVLDDGQLMLDLASLGAREYAPPATAGAGVGEKTQVGIVVVVPRDGKVGERGFE